MKLSRQTFIHSALAMLALGAGGAMTLARPAPKHKGMARGLTLLSFERDGQRRLGVKTEHGILDVVAASAALHIQAPSTMDELLQQEQGPALNALVDAALKSGNARLFLSENQIVYAPVVSHPEKIVCVGLNYKKHVQEVNLKLPTQPVLFNKYNNALSAHKGKIKLPVDIAHKFDHEVELVMVIGKAAHNVSEAEALDYVAGYCVGNDFTARDLQFETGGQWMVGKTCDDFGVLGPYLVTADQIDPDNLNIECRVNGETRQSDNTRNFVFPSRVMVSYISKHLSLRPGDIIYTGTPAGVIYGLPKEKQIWLKPGDKVACSVEKLGELSFDLV